MGPILYGIILFFLGGILWFLFSIAAAAEQLSGQIGIGAGLMYVFGIAFFFRSSRNRSSSSQRED